MFDPELRESLWSWVLVLWPPCPGGAVQWGTAAHGWFWGWQGPGQVWSALPVSQACPAVVALHRLGWFFLGKESVSIDFWISGLFRCCYLVCTQLSEAGRKQHGSFVACFWVEHRSGCAGRSVSSSVVCLLITWGSVSVHSLIQQVWSMAWASRLWPVSKWCLCCWWQERLGTWADTALCVCLQLVLQWCCRSGLESE